MTGLEDFPIDLGSGGGSCVDHGNALPILFEIRHALQRLIANGESTTIDLSSIPFGPGDEDRLIGLLGVGEVEATIDALGATRVRETAIPGVWLVDHRNRDAERLALQLEVTTIPELLRTQEQDLAIAVATLDTRLGPVQGLTRPQS